MPKCSVFHVRGVCQKGSVKEMTNADKINNMTNAELLFFMYDNGKCGCCTHKDKEFCLYRCEEGITNWLNKPLDELK